MELDAVLEELAVNPEADLDVGELALWLARDEYADLDVDAYLSELDSMAREARCYLGGGLEARVTGLCRYLFHEMGYHGNTRDYYDPRNSYLNQVLDRRTGIPITLSVVAMSLARRIGLDVVGVGLPGHFVAKAVHNGSEVLFDPFHGGRLLTTEQCEHLVQQVTGRPFQATPFTLQATPSGPIVHRMLTNLKGIYLQASDFPRAVRVIQRLRQLAPEDLLQRRDLGATLLQAGRPGPAIDHLAAYLAAAPEGPDLEEVRKLLERAKGDLARWN